MIPIQKTLRVLWITEDVCIQRRWI